MTIAEKKYIELFPEEAVEEKAKAFDKIAKCYYLQNFGTMQKSDFDVLMFSIYLERILDQSEMDMQSYSDYELSKLLGIPQSKVSTLKVKKQLKYPYEKFEWQESFKRISENVRYEDGKIKLFVPDKNLYLELKNAIEVNNGYTEAQLNPKLLVVSPEFFIDLLLMVAEDKDREELRKKLRSTIRENCNKNDIEYLERETVSETIKSLGKDFGINLVCDLLKLFIPEGRIVSIIAQNVINVINAVGENI